MDLRVVKSRSISVNVISVYRVSFLIIYFIGPFRAKTMQNANIRIVFFDGKKVWLPAVVDKKDLAEL
jgi:hypothetical protein